MSLNSRSPKYVLSTIPSTKHKTNAVTEIKFIIDIWIHFKEQFSIYKNKFAQSIKHETVTAEEEIFQHIGRIKTLTHRAHEQAPEKQVHV